MEKVYLNERICNLIKDARQKVRMSSKDLAYTLKINPSRMSRVENNIATYISKKEAKQLETILGIVIGDTTKNELLQKYIELMEENKRLKELLIENYEKLLAAFKVSTPELPENIVNAFAPQGSIYNGAGKTTDTCELDMWTINEQI